MNTFVNVKEAVEDSVLPKCVATLFDKEGRRCYGTAGRKWIAPTADAGARGRLRWISEERHAIDTNILNVKGNRCEI
jgi:hypothetical protein